LEKSSIMHEIKIIAAREKYILIHTTEHDIQFHKNLQFGKGNTYVNSIKGIITTANLIFGFASIGIINYESLERNEQHFKHKIFFVLKA